MTRQKAIGYVCDIPIPETDLSQRLTDFLIRKEEQLFRIRKYAKKENIELVGIIEDDELTEPFIDRPGIQKILHSKEDFDVLLVERVWCLSRKMKELTPFLEELYKRNIELQTSSYLWDCVSQQVRHNNLAKKLRKARTEAKKIREAA